MNKQQIIEKLETCISILSNTDNVYVTKQLESVAKALIEEWNEIDGYMQEIIQVLNYEKTMSNLDKITIR